MDIHDVLGYGIIITSDQELGLIVVWNESSTFNVFHETEGEFHNTDVFTRYDVNDCGTAQAVSDEYLAQLDY